MLGERETGTARLEEAVTACRSALEERTRERAPLDWAETQINLANAFGVSFWSRTGSQPQRGPIWCNNSSPMPRPSRRRRPLCHTRSSTRLGPSGKSAMTRKLPDLVVEVRLIAATGKTVLVIVHKDHEAAFRGIPGVSTLHHGDVAFGGAGHALPPATRDAAPGSGDIPR
jgi:hypothetical protein